MMVRLRRRGWSNLQRRARSNILYMSKKYPETRPNAMKLRRVLGGADSRPAASDTIAKVAAMIVLRPFVASRSDLRRARLLEPQTSDAPGNEIPAVLSRGPVVGSSNAARRVNFF